MRIFITGASGTVGRQTVLDRLRKGDQVRALTRSRSHLLERMAKMGGKGPGELEIIEGDPCVPGTWQSKVDGCDAVVHLAGAGLMDRRWTSAYQSVLRGSRVDSTYQVVRAIEQSARRPRALLNASAIGFYGDRDDRQLVESDGMGRGFLAHLCAEWEAQALRAEPSCRVVCMRFGMILDRDEGALPRLLKVFRLGLGGRLGHGRQYMSWITLPDVVSMINLLLTRGDLRGPVNVVSPEPLSNHAFTAALAAVLRRPAILRVPRWALKLALGRAAEVVLTSQRVLPKVVLGTSFNWESSTITRAFRTILFAQAEAVSESKPEILLIDIDTISPGARPLRLLLKKANEAGIRVVLVTSMGPEGAREFLAQCRLDCPVIAADGAVIVQRDAGAVLHRFELSPELQDGLMKAIATCGSGIEVTLEDLQSARRVSTAPGSTHPIKDCIRMRITAPEPMIESVLQAIGPGWWQPGKVLVHRDRPGRVDIMSSLAERSVAAQWLVRRWGGQQMEVRAVLQSVRSCGLAQWCGQSIALDSSEDRLQELCDRTTTTAGIDGVAEAVDDFL